MGKVLVVGTGTIGKPLIGLLTKRREELGIREVAFHKRTPELKTRASVRRLIQRDAIFVTDQDQFGEFAKLGLEPQMSREEALAWADVVIDCTPAGLGHKTGEMLVKDKKTGEKKSVKVEPWYPQHEATTRGFIAQGSEDGFGVPFALDVNNDEVADSKWRQVVSCNTHNILALLNLLRKMGLVLIKGRFVMIRRATDISQAEMISAPKVDKHKEVLKDGDVVIRRFGTHHAYDAWRLLQLCGLDLNLFSSALQIPSQYMHVCHFNLEVADPPTLELLIAAIREQPLMATTWWDNTGQVFSEARDDGFYGRFLDQTVIPVNTLEVNGNEIVGFAFTPQDGNSLLSSAAAVTQFFCPDDWRQRIDRAFGKYMFKEV